MADTTKNIGSVGQQFGSLLPGMTPKSNWESLFHNSITGGNTATGAGARPASIGGSAFIPGDTSFATGQKPLDLGILAQPNGPTHQQRWSGSSTPAQGTSNPLAGTGYEGGNAQEILDKYQTPGTSVNPYATQPSTNPFGWDKAFTG